MKNVCEIPKNFQEHIKLEQIIIGHQGGEIFEKIKEIERSLYIFQGNFKELLMEINNFSQPENLVFFDVRNRENLESILVEIARRLHNFVAAALSLVEHTRRIVKEMYENTPFILEYKSELEKRIIFNEQIQFVHDLRNFTLHYELPPIAASLELNVIEHKLTIDIESLKKWTNWKSIPKKFLAVQSSDIILIDLVKKYAEIIFLFHDWLYNKQCEIHKEIFDEFNALNKAYSNSQWAIKF
ncbi:MAG: hypothetical protein M3367_10700 [Acidobacteriota bacterium]|nr:hypothetical protein [Acidobacteriota bacterium]